MRTTLIVAAALVASSGSALGQIAPAFSVGRMGPSGLATQFLYNNTDTPGTPTAFAGGLSSGLTATDAINGFSQREMVTEFLLCFSIDRMSTGLPGLAPVANPLFPAFNVTNQATLGQQAGDAFLSTEAFSRAGILGSLPGMGEFNNVLAINQSPTYPSDFGLMPNIGPNVNAGGAPMDDIVGGGSSGALASGGPLYFTIDDPSTSYFANEIVVDPTPLLAGGASGDETIFATSVELGLGMFDDINAMSVFDVDANSDFTAGDQVLFSLSPASPLLAAMGWSAADVLTISPGDAAPSIFAFASDLGLLPGDNLDMLELVPLQGTAEQTIINKVPAPGTLVLVGSCALIGGVRRRR